MTARTSTLTSTLTGTSTIVNTPTPLSAAANADLMARLAAVEAERDAALLLAAERLEELTARDAADFLSADALRRIVNALLAAIDGSRQAPGAKQLFAGGAPEMLTKEQQTLVNKAERIWALSSSVVDAALAQLPELKSKIEVAMRVSHIGDRLPPKTRRAFLLINAIARVRTTKDEAACALPWALSIFLFALNVPSVAIEGVRSVLDCVVTYRRTWSFLHELAGIVHLSYPKWWPGEQVGFATDNFQEERSWRRDRGGQYNNEDTNLLQQADFAISFKLTNWWVPGRLSELGMMLKSINKLRRSDFELGAVQPWLASCLDEFSLDKAKGRVYLQRRIERLEFASQRAIYPKAQWTAPDWSRVFLTTDEGTGVHYRILPPAEWRKVDVRVLKLQLKNTVKPEQVGQANDTILGWFSVGTDAPGRSWTLHIGDFILYAPPPL